MNLKQADELLNKHLAQSAKASHSQMVAYLMGELAQPLRQDGELWEIIGLVHDLDENVTKNDRSRHGMVTAEWLDGQLSQEALEAIKAHDHRTGVKAETKVADALKLADALAIADEDAGRAHMVEIGSRIGQKRLLDHLGHRPYLLPIIVEKAECLGIDLKHIADIVKDAPAQ